MKTVFFALSAAALASALDIQFKKVKSPIFFDEEFETGFAQIEDRGEMFFWNFPAKNDAENAPLVIWFSGGPGCAAEFGVLREHGPFRMHDGVLSRNPHSFSEIAHVVYVDQPIGAGYSTPSSVRKAFPSRQTIASDVRTFLDVFFRHRPHLANRPLYLTGESYAGHYLPPIIQHLIDRPLTLSDGSEKKIEGLMVTAGWFSPHAQYPTLGQYTLEEHLIKDSEFPIFDAAFKQCGEYLCRHPHNVPMVEYCNLAIVKAANGKNIFNHEAGKYDDKDLVAFLNRQDVKDALLPSDEDDGEGKPRKDRKWRVIDPKVYASLLARDLGVDVRAELSRLIQEGRIRTLLAVGDKDVVTNWRSVEQVAYSLGDADLCKEPKDFSGKKVSRPRWTGAGKLRTLPFEPFAARPEDVHFKTVGHVSLVKIYNAGHMLPMDNPAAALAILKAFAIDHTLAPPAEVTFAHEGVRLDADGEAVEEEAKEVIEDEDDVLATLRF